MDGEEPGGLSPGDDGEKPVITTAFLSFIPIHCLGPATEAVTPESMRDIHGIDARRSNVRKAACRSWSP